MVGDPVDPYTGGYDQAVLQDIQRTQMQLNMTLAQFQLNFKDEIERFDMILRGVVKDAKTGGLVQMYEPIVNERGRAHIMKKIRMWFTKIVAQSDFEEEMIRKWCLVYSRELIIDAYSFGYLWDLKQDEFTSFVHDMVLGFFAIASCAKDAGLRQQLGQISKVLETYNNTIPQKRGLIP